MSSRRFTVTAITPCADCAGSGLVAHPLWAALLSCLPQPDQSDISAFFHTSAETEWPRKEITCIECHGTGVSLTQVPLAEALLELGFSIEETV